MRSQCGHSMMSQIHKIITWGHSVVALWCHRYMDMTTSPWGHSVVTERCSPCDVIMMSLWYRNYDITCIHELCMRSQWDELTTSPWGHSVFTVWCHRYTRWPHHHAVTVLSQDDAHFVMSSWHHYDITIMSSYVWVLCDIDMTWYHVLTGTAVLLHELLCCSQQLLWCF